MLSATSLSIFLTVPLSGLTMELTTVSAPSSAQAAVLGPTPETFNPKGIINIPQIARGKWKAGGRTTPADSSFFYAPEGTANVSTEFFQDQIQTQTTRHVQSFLPPAVNGLVKGNFWGMLSNISCKAVDSGHLKLIKAETLDAYPPTYSVYTHHENGQPMYDRTDATAGLSAPLWVNETAVFRDIVLYSMVAKADGTWYGDTIYDSDTNHDYETFDSASGATPDNEVTTGLFEIYLCQAYSSGIKDPNMTHLLESRSPSVHVVRKELEVDINRGPQLFDLAGFGVQCYVKLEMGNAYLDPATRTCSSFIRGANANGTGGDDDTYPRKSRPLKLLEITILLDTP